MKTLLKKIRWDVTLEAVVVFALLGAVLEGLHPGLVSDVVPWSAVAAVALALSLSLAVFKTEKVGHNVGPSRRPRRTVVIAVAVILAIASSAAAYSYFAPIPRFQPVFAAAVGLIVILAAVVLTHEKR